MNNVVILAAGDYPTGRAAEILEKAERVVCCDGAAREFVRRGGRPYAIVGDCDSLEKELCKRFAAILHRDPDQETNDLTKAARFCMDNGMRTFTILGATGGREDHTLANISLLVEYAQRGAVVRMVTGTGTFEPLLSDTDFDSFAGQQVSIFTLSPKTCITTVGLKYPLTRASLTGWWQGSLNESLGDMFSIRTTGPAIVYRMKG